MLLLQLEIDSIAKDEYEECGMNWLTATRNIVQAKTLNRRLTSLRQFGKWAGWGYLFEDYSAPTPLAGQPHPLPEGVEGVKRMIEVADSEHHAALIALCGLCGLRVAEALSVRATDFDLHQMTLTVHGKGDKTRIVPVSSYAWSVLQRPVARAWGLRNAPVVGIQDRAARSVVTNLAVRAHLKRHVSSHDLRATFATEVYNKTLDQRLVQMLLGHASGTTTEIYIGRTAEQMKVGVELL